MTKQELAAALESRGWRLSYFRGENAANGKPPRYNADRVDPIHGSYSRPTVNSDDPARLLSKVDAAEAQVVRAESVPR